MPETRTPLPPSSVPLAAWKKVLWWKLAGVVAGSIAGACLGGNVLVGLREPAELWRTPFPPEGIIGAVGGALLGGTLAGGRVGHFGVALLTGTAAGICLGLAYQPSPKSGLVVWGAIAGLLVGMVIGVLLEVSRPGRVPER